MTRKPPTGRSAVEKPKWKQCNECSGYGLSGKWLGSIHISFVCKKCEGEGFYDSTSE